MLADAVRRMAKLAPGVALPTRSPPKDVVEVFDRGGIDLLVMPEQYAARVTHPQARLFEDTQVCLVWSGHPTVGGGAHL